MNFITQPTTTASETTFLVVVVRWSCNEVNYCRWREHLNFVDDGRKIKKKEFNLITKLSSN